MMRQFLAILALAFISSTAYAKDVRVSAAVPLAEIKCFSYNNGWILASMGPCKDFRRPASIKLGEIFSENGNSHAIKIIIATQLEKDYDDGKVTMKEGDWYCVAAESTGDLKEQQNHRTWIFIQRCTPVE